MHPALRPKSVALYALIGCATLVVAVATAAAVEWVFSGLAGEPFQAVSAIASGIGLAGAVMVLYVWSTKRDE
jgi:hypothetical protein